MRRQGSDFFVQKSTKIGGCKHSVKHTYSFSCKKHGLKISQLLFLPHHDEHLSSIS